MGREWEGYRIIDDKMYGPDGRLIRPSHIALMGLLWQALAEADSTKYDELIKKAANLK